MARIHKHEDQLMLDDIPILCFSLLDRGIKYYTIHGAYIGLYCEKYFSNITIYGKIRVQNGILVHYDRHKSATQKLQTLPDPGNPNMRQSTPAKDTVIQGLE